MSPAPWARWATAWLLALALVALAAAGGMRARHPARERTVSRAYGVWWPVEIDIAPGERQGRAMLRRARELERSSRPDTARDLEVSRLAAARGDFELALARVPVDTGTAAAPAADSFRASLLLARARRTGSTSDLLDAAEQLGRIDGDVAAACNHVEIWEQLGLSYGAKRRARLCPLLPTRMPFLANAWQGKRVSAGDLPTAEMESVTALLARGDSASAVAKIRDRAQAWRTYFQREGLAAWVDRAADSSRRRLGEQQLLGLARAYERAVGNPAPARLMGELAMVRPNDLGRVTEGLRSWLAGSRLLSALETEQGVESLRTARDQIADLLPSLEPLIEAGLASTRYQLGDDADLAAQALALRQRIAGAGQPWVVARCLWLESLSLQGRAEWELSARLARRSAELFDRLGEPANAGFLGVMEAFDLESLNLHLQAETAYVAAIRKIARSGDTRQLATALEPFARSQGRRGRPHLAVAAQREVLAHRVADGNLILTVTSRALLAERLQGVGETERARAVLEQAEAELARVPSPGVQTRLRAILAHVGAGMDADTDPQRAIARFTDFLDTFGKFGERYYRADSLLQRARARLRMGDVSGATADLVKGAEETIDQGQRARGAGHSAALLNQVRETLDLLVEMLLRQEPNGQRALLWIETLKLQQQHRTLGLTPPVAGWSELPTGSCATEYYALARELLAWTRCGADPWRLTRVPVEREALESAVARLREGAIGGERASFQAGLERLSALLLAPCRQQLAGARSWSVVPDAMLSQVPFAWLESEGRSLFEDVDVTVAASLSELRVATPREAKQWAALAVGNPSVAPGEVLELAELPAAEAEARAVAARFGGQLLTGTQATFPAVVARLRHADLFHFAGHVYGNRDLPAMSRIQLAPSRGFANGRISAQRIADEDLSSLRLAVLAGCGSAADSARALGGSAELSQAFLAAGVETVVGTLWNVEDRAARAAFAPFYDHLAAGETPAMALRATWRAALDPENAIDLGAAAALQRLSNELGSP